MSSFDGITQAYLIEGIRGSGKTVLMTMCSAELASQGNWIVIDLNSSRELLTDLAEKMSSAMQKIPASVQSGGQISAAGFGNGWNGIGNTNVSTISVIEKHLAEIRKKGKRLLITLDEVMHNENMRRFASEFQILIRKGYPVFLLMTGLYDQIYAIQNDPANTFLLRTPKVTADALSMFQITKQYSRIFKLQEDDARMLSGITKGYAFAFQALGMLYYEYHDRENLDDILSRLDELLDDFVYKKVWEDLFGQERRIVLAIGDESARVKDICTELEITSSVFSTYRLRLIRKGILQSPQYGFVALTLPRFFSIARNYV